VIVLDFAILWAVTAVLAGPDTGCERPGANKQAAVPSLVASVKDAGLLLASFGDVGHVSSLRAGASDGRTVDAFVVDGIMTLTI
jgi:hypothetical protein